MAQDKEEKLQGRVKRFFHAYWARKKWTLPLALAVVVLLVIAARPCQRYMVLGLFITDYYRPALEYRGYGGL